MPFKSEKQRRFLWLKHPDIAKRWAEKEDALTRRAVRARKKGKRKNDY